MPVSLILNAVLTCHRRSLRYTSRLYVGEMPAIILRYNSVMVLMLMTTLRTVGGSVMFAIPKSILEGLGLSANTQVGLSVSEGCLIVDPHPRPRYTLAELMEQCDLSAPVTQESRAWLADEPVGQEIL